LVAITIIGFDASSALKLASSSRMDFEIVQRIASGLAGDIH